LKSGKDNSLPTSVDITQYFTDSATNPCSYTSCNIVDNTETLVSWISEASLVGNICSFKVDTLTVRPSSIFYLKVFTSVTKFSSVDSRPISIQIKDPKPPSQPETNP
jgi:hypothetical protein